MRTFYLLIGLTLAFDAALLAWLWWAFHAPSFADRRISMGPKLKVSARVRALHLVSSSALSLATVLGVSYFAFDALFSTAIATSPSGHVIALEALAILLIYDFAYYALHRGMHHKSAMRWVHGVHHRAKSPSALESFFLHPAELLAGLGLLFGATWLVGRLSPWGAVHSHAFVAAFFVYSTLNILIHSGLDFGRAGPHRGKSWLAPIDALTRKHHVHHHDDFGRNFSSLTPLPDWLFGTAG